MQTISRAQEVRGFLQTRLQSDSAVMPDGYAGIPESLRRRRVALVHYWFLNGLGGERVTRVLAQMFPNADIFALLVNPERLPVEIKSHRMTASFLQHVPGARRWHRHFMPLYPFALEQFDLREYDLVISAESGPAKGVITSPDTCHVCLCHSPMRYIWDMYHDYRMESGLGTLRRVIFSLSAHYMRLWDVAAAQRVDHFVAISRYVAGRVRKYYQREAAVIYPPLKVNGYISDRVDDYYLVVSRLVDYKRIDLAIQACNRLGRKLRVIGDGEQYKSLKKIAGPAVEFLGFLPDEEVREQFAHCRALLFPGKEDLGATPAEAQSFGRPVIAYGRGGALETIVDYSAQRGDNAELCTGILFNEQTAESLSQAVLQFESVEHRFSPGFTRSSVLRFGDARFRSEMYEYLARCVAEHDAKW